MRQVILVNSRTFSTGFRPRPPAAAILLCKIFPDGPYGWRMKIALIVIAAAVVAIAGILLAGELGHAHHHLAIVRVVWPGHWIARR